MLSLGHQLFQLLGAMLILVAYISHQLRVMNPDRYLYNIMNGVGSAILGYYAIWPRFQAGFVVLEVAWTAVSIFALYRAAKMNRAGKTA